MQSKLKSPESGLLDVLRRVKFLSISSEGFIHLEVLFRSLFPSHYLIYVSNFTSSIMKTLTTTALFTLASLASAQYGGYGGDGSGNPSTGSGSGSGSSGSGSGFNPFSSGDSSILGFNVNTAETYRLAHGVMASLAFVIFFPAGAISIRIISGRFALLLHVAFQMLAYALFICAFALGIWMVTHIKFEGFDLVSDAWNAYGTFRLTMSSSAAVQRTTIQSSA
jgi:hypothetical protein